MSSRVLAAEALHTARLEWGGGEFYGREAVEDGLGALEGFSPIFAIYAERFWVELDAGSALCADVWDGRLARVWRLGREPHDKRPQLLDIPSDPRLDQAGAALRFAPEDHPDLQAADVARLAEAVSDWRDAGLPIRIAPLVLRAASGEAGCAALIRLEGERPGETPTPLACWAVAHAAQDAVSRILDTAGLEAAIERTWSPGF